MKYLYKYPQAAYPYNDLVAANRRRSRNELEYELIDTGIFDGDRYFDVFVEYEGSPGRPAESGQYLQSRARGGSASRVADPLVPQHLVVA